MACLRSAYISADLQYLERGDNPRRVDDLVRPDLSIELADADAIHTAVVVGAEIVHPLQDEPGASAASLRRSRAGSLL